MPLVLILGARCDAVPGAPPPAPHDEGCPVQRHLGERGLEVRSTEIPGEDMACVVGDVLSETDASAKVEGSHAQPGRRSDAMSRHFKPGLLAYFSDGPYNDGCSASVLVGWRAQELGFAPLGMSVWLDKHLPAELRDIALRSQGPKVARERYSKDVDPIGDFPDYEAYLRHAFGEWRSGALHGGTPKMHTLHNFQGGEYEGTYLGRRLLEISDESPPTPVTFRRIEGALASLEPLRARLPRRPEAALHLIQEIPTY